jgi:hypothetical protein
MTKQCNLGHQKFFSLHCIKLMLRTAGYSAAIAARDISLPPSIYLSIYIFPLVCDMATIGPISGHSSTKQLSRLFIQQR